MNKNTFALGSSKGFTLLEILLVVGLIAILAGIVIIAINPNKQLGDTRNAQRKVDINTILNAVYQYRIDGNPFPSSITSTAKEICKTGVSPATCASDGLADLSDLTEDEKFIVSMPTDPECATVCDDPNGVGYTISKSANNRITVAAPGAEGSPAPTISATR